MKHTNTLLIQLFITLFLFQFTFAQKLFLKTKPSDDLLHEMQLSFPRVDMQNIKVNTLFLELNESFRRYNSSFNNSTKQKIRSRYSISKKNYKLYKYL